MRRLAAGLALAGALLGGAAPLAAQPPDYTVERLSVTIQVDAGGGMAVREALTLRFPRPGSELIRVLPLAFDRRGLGLALDPPAVSVLDERGGMLPAAIGRSARRLRLRVAGLGPGRRTITLLYRFRQGLLPVDDHQELLWRVKGAEWEVPVETAEVLIALPAGLPLTHVWTTGAISGSSAADDVRIQVAERFVSLRAGRPLAPHEELSVALSWHASLGLAPSLWRRAGWLLGDGWPLALPLLIAGAFLLWGRRRGAPSTRSGELRIEPPAGLSPGEAGALLAGRAGVDDAVATLLDLAGRELVLVEEVAGGTGEADWRLHLRLPEPAPALAPHERELLSALFGSEAAGPVLLSCWPRPGARAGHRVAESLERSLGRRGLLVPSWAGGALRAGGVLLLVAGAAGLSLTAEAAPRVWAIAAVASGLCLLAAGGRLGRRTRAGLSGAAAARAFATYLSEARPGPSDAGSRACWPAWALALGVYPSWRRRWVPAGGGGAAGLDGWFRPLGSVGPGTALDRFVQAARAALGPADRGEH